jgi:hypothetical protein
MKETSKKFLDKLFNPEDEISISPNEYAFKSLPLSKFGGAMELEAQGNVKEEYKIKKVHEDQIILTCINPVKGDKNDSNCTAFRTFLIECDDGDIYDQKKYIESLKMPYTVCVFSGNKSLHYGITLSEDLPTIELWRDINEWILAIVSKADQQNKNPTKSIRFPGNKRTDGKGLMQSLVDVKERVDLDVLLDWLDQKPELNPRLNRPKKRPLGDMEVSDTAIPKWVAEKLAEGVGRMGSRNKEWFMMAMEMAKRGNPEEEIIKGLGPWFVPEHDFTLREWHTTIKSAIKRVERGMYD